MLYYIFTIGGSPQAKGTAVTVLFPSPLGEILITVPPPILLILTQIILIFLCKIYILSLHNHWSFLKYGGPEGPCLLLISPFQITNFEFSYYQLPIWIFLITNFEFSHF